MNKMQVLYAVFSIASYFCLASAEQTSVCVVAQENSHTASSCDVNITIQDLDQYLHGTSPQDVTITLYSTNILLDRLISIQNKTSISVDGHKISPVITCDKTNSGFSFTNVTNITLTNFEVRNCGADHNSTSKNTSSPEKNLISRSAMFFVNSSNVKIIGVNISHSDGTGIAMFDNSGSSYIENCHFTSNAVEKNNDQIFPGGGGLYIEFTYCTPGGLTGGFCRGTQHKNPLPHNSHWVIRGCTFQNNYASSVRETSTSYVRSVGNNFQGHGRGGGLGIILRGTAENNTIDISDCNFTNNSAIWGGGLYISLQESPRNNIVDVKNTNLTNNRAYLNGGGGIDVGFLFVNEIPSKDNKINFYKCKMIENAADYGGGVLVYSSASKNYTNLKNEINFDRCQWIRNRAAISAGINVSPHVWDALKRNFPLSTSFTNCKFESNFIDNSLNYSSYNKIEGKGTFVAVKMDIHFEGTTNFTNNTDTALYLVSSIAKFASNSDVTFERNTGKLGGAISMLGLSSLRIDDNSSFSFTENSAREKGGAIYQLSYNINDYAISRSCFIQYVGNNTNSTQRDIHFYFKGNSAGSSNGNDSLRTGDSIYTGTLRPCYTGCLQKKEHSHADALNCIANFSFTRELQLEISTVGENLVDPDREVDTVNIIPGGWMQLPILEDELQNRVGALYHVFIPNNATKPKNQSNGILLENEYTSNEYVKIYGSPGKRADIRVETVDVWEVAVTYHVRMVECPPGFSLLEIPIVTDKLVNSCECSTTSKSNQKLYTGIVECYKNNFTALLRIGYWLGYDNENPREHDLKSAYCPIGYCAYNEANVIVLPNTTNKTELERLVCGNRTRKMCAYCRPGLSSHYHHPTFQCKSNEKCKLGFLVYFVTDIIPITLLFLVIIVFDISCTKGAVNGLIFYFQVIEIATDISSGFVRCHPPLFHFTEVFNLVTGIFSLNFFIHRDLSFCLWEGAQTLDLLAFRYVTITYSLLLVLMVITIVRVCNVRKVTQKIPKVCGREIGTKSTIIQGLSGFLVICYSESAKVSLMILTPVTVFGHSKSSSTAALYNGELNYFQGKHLAYALPALLFLIVLGLGPPVLLLSYPLCYRVFGWLKIGESKFVKILCKCLPLEKFKPFYDSFQSCFKDEYRFFSGLYFVYRLIILLAFSITRSVTNFYTTLIVGFSTIFCIHAVVQPYKKRWHNILDAYIFMTLTILSTLSLYIYRRALELLNNDHIIHVACTIKTILLYVPLVYFILGLVSILVVKGMQKIIEIRSRRRNCHNTELNVCEQELSESLLYDRRNSFANEK